MSRPLKDAIDYFPLDIDFFAHDKIRLLRGEFGAKGLIVYLYVLCDIYRTNGYFKVWDEDSCLLVSEGASCGVTPEFTSQVINGCVRRSLFDYKLFNVFRVLTSPGIQRRYIKACSARDEIRIKKEYWLLDINNKKDVSAGTLNKIAFFYDNSQKNEVNLQKNEVNSENNPQSKVKESKVKKKESKERSDKALSLPFSELLNGSVLKWFLYKDETGEPIGETSRAVLIDKISKKISEGQSEENISELIELCIERKWKGIIWDRLPAASERRASFDIDELDELVRQF